MWDFEYDLNLTHHCTVTSRTWVRLQLKPEMGRSGIASVALASRLHTQEKQFSYTLRCVCTLV